LGITNGGKMIKSIRCKLFGHKIITAGSCPFTGKSYNACKVCDRLFEQ
jgi:hypothetical protein